MLQVEQAELSQVQVDNLSVQVGGAIKSLRKMRGFTRKQLAQHLKISHQQLAKYENGVNRISAVKLYKIACIFGVSLDYFFSIQESVAFNNTESNREIMDLVKNYALIKSSKQKEVVRSIIKAMGD